MSSSYQYATQWNPQRFIHWAQTIGEHCKSYILQILEKKQHLEQSHKTCMGILTQAVRIDLKGESFRRNKVEIPKNDTF
jgi:hypothetical protein